MGMKRFDVVAWVREEERRTDTTDGWPADLSLVPPLVRGLHYQRLAARSYGDWAESDRLRQELMQLGYNERDSADSCQLRTPHWLEAMWV